MHKSLILRAQMTLDGDTPNDHHRALADAMRRQMDKVSAKSHWEQDAIRAEVASVRER